jgi:AcrR family transcriptional regulator
MSSMTTLDRPLRKDAERNRQRILNAARELFAERGLGVTLNDIAHHAGVGVGTVYRRFPDKMQLIEGLFEQAVADIVALADAGLEDPDPWHGLTTFVERACELQADDRGFKEVVLGAPGGLERVDRIRAKMMPLVTRLVGRARDAGQLRKDIEAQDIPIIQLMMGTVIDCARDVQPELWRRFLAIYLRGLRAECGPPDALPQPPLDPIATQRVMAAWEPPRR